LGLIALVRGGLTLEQAQGSGAYSESAPDPLVFFKEWNDNMKIKILKGHVSMGTGAGNAGKNLRTAAGLLLRKGIAIQRFFSGTVNINLDDDFFCDTCYAVCVTQAELLPYESVAKQNEPDEIWRFIPVLAVNDESMEGFIYRTNHPWHKDPKLRYGIHGPRVIELLTKQLAIKDKDPIRVTILESP
jgi:hypothetical protein